MNFFVQFERCNLTRLGHFEIYEADKVDLENNDVDHSVSNFHKDLSSLFLANKGSLLLKSYYLKRSI